MIVRFLSSLRLTLALMLGLALVSVFGTFRPAASGRYELFYQSAAFRLLFALLALNLLVCTIKTIRRNLRDRQRYFDTLSCAPGVSDQSLLLLPPGLDLKEVQAKLRSLGYKGSCRNGMMIGVRGRAGRWGSTVVHLACLAIMAGAFAGELGFVGTLNIHEGNQSPNCFDWDKQADRPLGFEFRLDDFQPLYYPIDIQLAAYTSDGRMLAEYTTREGEKVELPVPGVSAKVVSFDHFEKLLELDLFHNGAPLGQYRAFSDRTEFDSTGGRLGLALRPTAFRDPLLKQMRSQVSIIENGEVVKQGVIQVNQPLVHRGVAIYQTAFDRDKFGFWYAGFQFSKDPGEPLVWSASIVLVLGLALAFCLPCRVVGVARTAEGFTLVALAGFGGKGGKEVWDRLSLFPSRLAPESSKNRRLLT